MNFSEEALEGMRQFQKANLAWLNKLEALQAQLAGTAPPKTLPFVEHDFLGEETLQEIASITLRGLMQQGRSHGLTLAQAVGILLRPSAR
jgi:hypothetical protein